MIYQSLTILFIFFSLISTPVMAKGNDKDGNLSKEARQSKVEMHEKMAEMHRKMADCLKSDKPLQECRQEKMKEYPMLKDKCEMMDGGMKYKHQDKMKKEGNQKEVEKKQGDLS